MESKFNSKGKHNKMDIPTEKHLHISFPQENYVYYGSELKDNFRIKLSKIGEKMLHS